MTDLQQSVVPTLSTGDGTSYGAEMHIRVLGPVEVLGDGVDVRLGGRKQRTALALLVAEVGKVVSVDALIDGLWGDEPTPGARSTLQTYVSNLRAVLGDVIVREGGGYRLAVDPQQVDAVQFESAVARASDLVETRSAEASQRLRAALALWRGHPYADVPGSFRLELEAGRLEELRLAAVEARIEAELTMGQDSELIAELGVLCTEFPFREGFTAQHMLALYRAGRQAEALSSFQKTRTYLVEELGLDASVQLRELERRILNHDESLRLEAQPQVETLAFLLSDIEDSTVLWEMQTESMRTTVERHDRIVRAAVEAAGGRIVKRVGDGVDSAFADVGAAVAAAQEIQRGLVALDGLETGPLLVRMAVDVGEVEGRDGDYFGPVLNRAGRMLAAGHGGQLLLSADAHAALSATESGWQAKALGEYRFKGIGSPLSVFQLLVDGLPSEFPALRIDRLPPPAPSFGRSVRGYELREEVGSGDFGIVYRAYQPSVGREVAIKVIRSDLVNRPAFVRGFEAEARLVATLEHPHIVSLYDYWRDPDGAYLVMRWLRGGSLRQALDRGPWNLEPTSRLLEQIVSALSYAHRQGVIHGDLKPANVLLDDEGHAYLSDFGIATHVLDPASANGFVTSSPAYVSPEEVEGEGRTPRSDLYCVGLLTYELLTGRRPPMDGSLPSVTHVHPELAGEIDAVIATATALDPARRHSSVDEFLAAFVLASGASAPPPGATFTATDNPYKGLHAFGENDANDFFGRESLVGELLTATSEHRLIAVAGPSGIGKSSVVKAGLIPALRDDAMPGSRSWLVTDMFPGSYPFEELAAALLRVAVEWPDALPKELARDELGMRRVIKRILPPDTELLLVIDQFEELFTLTADEETRRSFLDGLAQLAADSRSRVRVIVTVRADFLDYPLRYPEIGELFKSGLVAVTTPSDDELTEAIRRPAERLGVRYEPGLVSRIIAEVRDQPGGLPLLQYALTELFAERTSDLLTDASYAATGGVMGALARRAEALWELLDEAGRTATRQVFLRLVTVDPASQDTRRRVRRSELRALELETRALDEILQRYGDHRLLTFDRDPVTRSPTVEVAHEALLTQWERLRGWINERREDLVLHRRMVEAVTEWDESGRQPEYLPREGRLAQFETWAEATDLALTRGEREFLRQGRRDEDERRARNTRRRRAVLAGFALAAALSILLAGLALIGRHEAKDNATLASARELAASAIGVLNQDPELSVLLAVRASETARPTFESVSALHEALEQDRTVWTLPQPPDPDSLSWGSLSPDGSLMLVGAIHDMEVWNVARQERLWKLHIARGELPLAEFSSDGSRVVGTISWDAESSVRPPVGLRPGIHVWNAATGHEVLYRRLPRCPALRFAQNGSRIDLSRPIALLADMGATTKGTTRCNSGRYQVSTFDIETGRRNPVALLNLGSAVNLVAIFAFATSADGRYVAIADGAEVRVVDTAIGRAVFSRSLGSIPHIALSATGDRLITAGGLTDPLSLWDVRRHTKIREFDTRTAGWLGLSRHDRTLVVMGTDGVVRIWDVASGRELLTLRGHKAGGRWASLREDGSELASFDAAGSLRLWTLADRGEVRAFSLHSGSYTAGGLDLAGGQGAATFDVSDPYEEAVVFDPATGAVESTLRDVTGQSVRLSPDGRRLAAQRLISRKSELFGPIVVHDLKTGASTEMQGSCVFAVVGEFPRCKDPPATPFREWVGSMQFSPNGSLLAVGSSWGALSVWDSASGTLLMNRPTNYQASIAFSPDGAKLVASTQGDGRLTVYDTSTWRVLVRRTFEEGWLRQVRFTPDGKHLVGASQSAKVVIVDTETWKPTAALVGHQGFIKDLEVSPDGTTIASSDQQGFVRIWDLKSGRPLEVIPVGETQVQNVEFLDNTHLLVTPNAGPDVLVMTIDVDELLRIARSRLTRSFTEEECQAYLHVDSCPAS